jgi:hypothetical protein
MILATHLLVYSDDYERTREFFRDVLRLPFEDTGGGWLIFRSGPSELASHPNAWEHEGQRGGTDQRYDISLACDDLAATMAELTSRGATFEGGVVEQRWGHTVQLAVPGAGTMTLYQPTYDMPALG